MYLSHFLYLIHMGFWGAFGYFLQSASNYLNLSFTSKISYFYDLTPLQLEFFIQIF